MVDPVETDAAAELREALSFLGRGWRCDNNGGAFNPNTGERVGAEIFHRLGLAMKRYGELAVFEAVRSGRVTFPSNVRYIPRAPARDQAGGSGAK